ncbi:MAG: YebC/PmpR family DNA-binding transcriptional regulator, partial [Planctomycetes bacterium]|nr:YebC/PmpR family DNA-binding transcriptional regulator [Planctomycetota bacterium]
LQEEGENYVILASPTDFGRINTALRERNDVEVKEADITLIPKNTVMVEDANVLQKILALMESLDDHEDVQNCYANFEVPEKLVDEL